MSVLFESNNCFFISHEKYIADVYKCTHNNGSIASYVLNKDLFNITKPYKKTNHKKDDIPNTDVDVLYIQKKYNEFLKKLAHIFIQQDLKDTSNSIALDTAVVVYNNSTSDFYKNSLGGNNFNYSTIQNINTNPFIFPQNSLFFNHNTSDIHKHITNKYDAILLDPPWWNKYIRRKRKKSNDSYEMLHNTDLHKLPIHDLLDPSGIVVVWCTNSPQHNKALVDMMRGWRVNAISRWFWLKVTVSGEPICGFSKPCGKQPFERIYIGGGLENKRLEQLEMSNGRLVVSVPSSLHSHKPPLVGMLGYVDELTVLDRFADYRNLILTFTLVILMNLLNELLLRLRKLVKSGEIYSQIY